MQSSAQNIPKNQPRNQTESQPKSRPRSQSVKNIYQILSRLRIYSLEQDSMIDGELAAYNTGFLWLEEALNSLQRRAFIQTASPKDLPLYEALVGLQHLSHLPEDTRRRQVIHRLSLAPYDFTVNQIPRVLQAVGLRGSLQQNYQKESLTLTVWDTLDPHLDLDQVSERLDSMLPTHLEWELIYGSLTWDLLEEQVKDWNHWDDTDFTWDEFDTQGETIFI